MKLGCSKLVFTFALSILLVACGEENPKDPNAETSISSFNVVGNLSASTISANTNDGVFSVSWKINSSELYHADLYVSDSNQLGQSTDVKFLTVNCAAGGSFICDETGDFSCSFTNNFLISCENGATSGNLTSFLSDTGLPTSAYVILEACNGARTNCQQKAVSVTLSQ